MAVQPVSPYDPNLGAYNYMPVNANTPIIPEIAQAFQNDPRTKLAQAAIASGTRTDPVARGGYGYADGIARVLQALAGTYVQNQEQAKYTGYQNTTLNNMKKMGLTGIGTNPDGSPVSPSVSAAPLSTAPGTTGDGSAAMMGSGGLPGSAVAPAAASVLDAPPPAPPSPPGPPPGPPGPGVQANLAPVPPASAAPSVPSPNVNPVTGAALNTSGMGGDSQSGTANPFPLASTAPTLSAVSAVLGDTTGAGSALSTNAPSQANAPGPTSPAAPAAPAMINGVPQLSAPAIPDAPAIIPKPDMPTVAPAQRSRMLDAAYQMMIQANPFLFDKANQMYAQGMSEQDKINQAVVDRQADLQKAGYVSGLEAANTSQAQASQAGWAARQAATTQGYDVAKTNTQMSFQDQQRRLTEANEDAQKALDRSNAINVAKVRLQAGVGDLTQDPDLLDQMAQQALHDPSVYTGLGRGPQGAKNVLALHAAVYKLARASGYSPEDVAALNAQFKGTQAEAVGVGRRGAATDVATSELPLLAQKAKEAHDALKQTDLVPYNQARVWYMNNTSSPALTKAMEADLAFRSALTRSFGSGSVSVHNAQEAQNVVNSHWGNKGYNAAIDGAIDIAGKEKAGVQSALGSIGGNLGGNIGRTSPAGTVAPRKPGETVSQYLTRTGG